MGLLAIILADLQALAAEAKSKFPPVKEVANSFSNYPFITAINFNTSQAADRAHSRLKAEEALGDVPALLKTTDDLFKPLLLACSSKHPKLVSVAVNSIQKLTAQGAVGKVGVFFLFAVVLLSLTARLF